MSASKGASGGGNAGTGRGPGKDRAARATSGDSDRDVPQPEDLARAQANGSGALCRLCYRPDGWLRFSPDADAGVVFIKFKFTCNRFYNKYVMVRVEAMYAEEGVALLEEKVERVYAGTLNPVEDHWFKHL